MVQIVWESKKIQTEVGGGTFCGKGRTSGPVIDELEVSGLIYSEESSKVTAKVRLN